MKERVGALSKYIKTVGQNKIEMKKADTFSQSTVDI